MSVLGLVIYYGLLKLFGVLTLQIASRGFY